MTNGSAPSSAQARHLRQQLARLHLGGVGGGAVARLENEALGRAVAEALDVEELVLTAERRTSTMNLKARLAKRRADACTMAANGGNPSALLKEAEGDVASAQADAAKSETKSSSSSSSTREAHGAAVKALDEAYRKDVTQMQTDLENRRKVKKEALQSKLADRRKARNAEGGGGKVSARVYEEVLWLAGTTRSSWAVYG